MFKILQIIVRAIFIFFVIMFFPVFLIAAVGFCDSYEDYKKFIKDLYSEQINAFKTLYR